MLEFANKTNETFDSAMTALEKEPHYSFTILKELTQGSGSDVPEKESQLAAVDSDQMLFFKVKLEDSKFYWPWLNHLVGTFRMTTKMT